MFKISNLSKQYKDNIILDNINWEIKERQFIILTGRSGGGKTTLLSIMGGLTKPNSGSVHIQNQDIWMLSEAKRAELRNKKLGFVFQFPSLIPTLNVLDNVLLPIAFSGKSPTIKDLKHAEDLLSKVNVIDQKSHFPSQLSGGQQRRVALARSLINDPSIILTDEPTGDLDEKSESEIMNLFKQINKDGVTIIMVTHALDYIHFGDETFTLKQGKLVPYEEQEVSSVHNR